jgi:outer membrane protein insertion porin family
MALWLRLFRELGLAGLILGGAVFGGAIGSMATADFAVAQTAASIVVEGNRRVEADTIRSYFRLAPGQRLDAAKIDEAYKALVATGLFQDVRITQAGGRLVVSVIENAVINRIAFEGNKKVKDDQLSSEVQSKPHGTLSRPQVQADVQRIVEIYRRNGRFDVRVTPKIIELPNNRVDLVFEINEGEKTGVRKIIFVGNNTFGDQRLKDEIKTNETMWLLNFLQTADIYDADRVEADRDLIRRFYLKKGFADVRVVSAVAEYDPEGKGFIITFTIEEGPRYRFGSVEVRSNVPAIDPNTLYPRLKTSAGTVYNAEAVEKSVENTSIEVARRGYPFATVRPIGERDREKGVINLVYVVDEGPRIYIERINVRGNIRTRDWVIRREFDIAEGDAYNRALIDRAERRLKNLNYFKTVKITNEPGSAQDRIVVNVDVEELSTGELSLAGGYSTADGFMAEVSIGERNLLGNGQYARASIQYGQRARGFEITYLEPFFLGYRLAAGFDIYAKHTLSSSYYSYENKTIGVALRTGFALSEEFGVQMRYNIYQQKISLPDPLRNCNNVNPSAANGTFPTSIANINPANGLPWSDPANGSFTQNCYADGESSLAVRRALAQGAVLVSLVGYSLGYNTLDNNKNPTSGVLIDFRQDVAGVGGDVNFLRTTIDARTYYEMFADIVTVFRAQAGHIVGWNNNRDGQDISGFRPGSLRMLDHFQMGPNLVRGFAPAGIGPRDTTVGSFNDALGGTMYWGTSVEAQIPIHFIPKDVGVKFAVFADAGSLWGYRGPTSWSVTGESLTVGSDNMTVRSSVGAGIIWNSPFGPLRFDYAFPLTKWCPSAAAGQCDRIQQLRFGGGTRF